MTQYASKPSVLLGLIGQDIQGSRTPEMHMREGEAQGLRLVYRLIDLTKLGLGAEALPELLTAAQRMGFNGLNITHPCKQAIIPHLDELSENARALGAVNTVIIKDGKKIGENTDWSGFAEPFRRKMSDVPSTEWCRSARAGPGRRWRMRRSCSASRNSRSSTSTPSAPRAWRKICRSISGPGAPRLAATCRARSRKPTGSSMPRPSAWTLIPACRFPPNCCARTCGSPRSFTSRSRPSSRRARALGARTIDGGGMAVFQAVAAFRHFTGLEPDSDRMLAHFAEMRAP